MKKTLIALAVIIPSVTSVAHAADGQINFTGTITDVACTVDAASAGQIVNLGTVNKTALSGVGATAAPTKFDIKLTNCPASVTAASVKFDGLINEDNSALLSVGKAGGAATGVGIAIYEADSTTQIPMLTASARKTIDSATATNTLSYVAKYMATKVAVVSGTANAVTDFTIVYN